MVAELFRFGQGYAPNGLFVDSDEDIPPETDSEPEDETPIKEEAAKESSGVNTRTGNAAGASTRAPSSEVSFAGAPSSSPAGSNSTKNSIELDEADTHSIFVWSLPMNASPSLLHEEFKRFGDIKHGGITLRRHKIKGFCFAFIEFEAVPSVQSAIEASPVTIGGEQAYIEQKRPGCVLASSIGSSNNGERSG